ncbi:prepilin peptidase [Candidatus Pacearchaeota archaeon]|nr:prepilin peptidase [Candidatus Pacearchaeota archaeon]
MQEYYFLFILAFIFTTAAVIQDLKSREVANWINFSFIAFALAYRAFYAIQISQIKFFALGIAGFVIFFALAHLLYYSKAFAGGDAKLLMGYGIILPYQNYSSLPIFTITFILLLFTIGALYSLVYSAFIAAKNKEKFKKEFYILFKKYKLISIILLLLSLATIKFTTLSLFFALLFLILIIYIYTKSVDSCMIILTPPSKLTEGDWLISDVKISKSKTIRKTVHGLSSNDIKLLRKSKRKILIKTGIPFTPAFLLALILMVSFFLTSAVSPEQIFSSLFSQLFFLS